MSVLSENGSSLCVCVKFVCLFENEISFSENGSVGVSE